MLRTTERPAEQASVLDVLPTGIEPLLQLEFETQPSSGPGATHCLSHPGELALDMIDETRSWGIEVPQVIADGGYGDTAVFRLGLETRGLDYVVGISTTTTAQPEDTQPRTPAYPGRGRRTVPA
ncbi:transposase [Streptomyces sp. NPDC059092]|uniref:transposase n=1 Tax=Streptomyces sp. NPDC059092 TaxID=3346725 RepID=UPI003695CB6F